ncbi:MAG: methylmalonyl-CoA epimerase [Alphaproteobacteria bacterium]|nr:methylmalonyl-CoA epimerase [Alphaproteobacteria bacterium]MBL6776801.1 methylmalonyl-CoA epimerase [Alphaproteobacteria bacterium]
MIGSINHIAIAVPDIRAAMAQWQERVGAEISEIQTLPEHGVHVAFIKAENGKVELLEPIDENSPIAKFLEKNADGGMHHICFDVEDLIASRDKLIAAGGRVLGSDEPRIGAHGKPVIFIHPKDLSGTLIELQQA